MSTRAKITLGSSIVWAVACVIGVHYMKIWEKDYMRRGVRKFDEERERQKFLNMLEHEEMEKKRTELLAEQTLENKAR